MHNDKYAIVDRVCREIADISSVSELQEAKKNYMEFLLNLPPYFSNKIYESLKAKEKQLS